MSTNVILWNSLSFLVSPRLNWASACCNFCSKGCTTSSQSYIPVELLVLCRTSHPDCTVLLHALVLQQGCTTSPQSLNPCGTPCLCRTSNPDCAGHLHLLVSQQGCTTSPQSHNPVELLVRCRTSHPDGTGHLSFPFCRSRSVPLRRSLIILWNS